MPPVVEASDLPDPVFNLADQRNVLCVEFPPLAIRCDAPMRPNKPGQLRMAAKVHNVHFQVLVIQVRQAERVHDSRSQALRVHQPPMHIHGANCRADVMPHCLRGRKKANAAVP